MRIHRTVFFTSSGFIILFVLLGALFSEPVGHALDWLQDVIITYAGWFYIAAVAFFFLFVVWLFFSPYGSVRLGKDDEEPAYSYTTWFAMLFSAGMGIGLLFFSVAEPVLHFVNARGEVKPESFEAARQAMTLTFFHWGLHAWAIYTIVGLALAYFAFRHGLPLSIRSALYPLIGERVHGAIGNIADIVAVFGTLFGLATSLGLGVMQVNAGLEYLGLLSISRTNQVILIGVITLAASVSVASGLDKGVRRLSELNLLLAGLLLLFVLIAGPTVFLLSSFVQNIGRYVSSLARLTFSTDAYVGLDWQKSWTMFYWAWWISWSPFVGMFIARVSRGRTVRQFVAGVLFVPVIITFFWFSIFGGTALYIDLYGSGGMAEAVSESIPTAIFVMLEKLPMSRITAALATAVVAVFFVTSADSGSLVIDIITSGGRSDTPVFQRVFWAISEGAVAAVLLVTGGLVALQTAAITTALPFSVLMLFICFGLLKGLRAEVMTSDPLAALHGRMQKRGMQQRQGVTDGIPPAAQPEMLTALVQPKEWRGRLKELMDKVAQFRRSEPSVEEADVSVDTFFEDIVLPTFGELKEALEQYERDVWVQKVGRRATLLVFRGGQEEFAYAVQAHVYHRPTFMYPEQAQASEAQLSTRAEVVLRSGTRSETEIHNWTKDSLLEDFIQSYARWMGW